MNQQILLSDIGVSEKTERMYAQIIAEEDMGEIYGTKIIIQERVQSSRQRIF